MKQDSMIEIIQEQTIRALWEVRNVIDCVPDELWNREYCGMPCLDVVSDKTLKIEEIEAYLKEIEKKLS